MITRRIKAEEFNGVMSTAEIIRELGKYSRKMMNGVNCSANNLLIISQLGVLAEHSFNTSFTPSQQFVYLQKPTSLITSSN